MRVVFDGYWWVEGPLSNQMVQRQFILTWLRDYPRDEAIVVVPQPAVATARQELDGRALVVGTRWRPHALGAAFATAYVARRHRADVIVAHNFTPLAGPAVTFIHDVLFLTHPEWFTTAEKIYLAPIPLLARRARSVATSSASEARRIESTRPALSPVGAVGLAISPALRSARPVRPDALRQVSHFVLTVGRLNVRKNLARTIAAAVASPSVTPDCPLIVVGEPDGRGLKADADVAQAREDGTVVFLSRVSDAELAWLYANTGLFVFLTLDEGWGLPLQEAEYFGAQMLVSDIPVFREISSGACHFINPLDTAAIADAFSQLRTSLPVEARLRTEEDALADNTWAACTKRLRNIAVEAANAQVKAS